MQEPAEDLFLEFVKAIQEMVEAVGPELGPQDDWPAALAAGNTRSTEVYEGRLPLDVATLPPGAFENDGTKDVVAEFLIPLYVRRMDADMAAFFSTAWVSLGEAREDPKVVAALKAFEAEHGRPPRSYDELEALGVPRPVNDPKRQEGVTIMARTKAGRTMLSTGLIKRHRKHPPQIERWENMEEEGMTAAGRFADGLELAFSSDRKPIIDDPVLAQTVDRLLDKVFPKRPSTSWKEQ